MVSKLGGSSRGSGICKLGEVGRSQTAWYERRENGGDIVKSRQHDYAAAQRKDREAAEAAADFEAFVKQQQAQADALLKADQARADARLRVDQARADARARLDGVRSVTLRGGQIDPRGYSVTNAHVSAVKSGNGDGLFGSIKSRVGQAAAAVRSYAGGAETIVRSTGPSSVPPPIERPNAPPPPRTEAPERRPDFDRPITKREADTGRR